MDSKATSAQHAKISLLSLPAECLERILDHVGPGSLYALLTVCKALFLPSIQRLYYDPMKIVRQHNFPRLLYLFFRISPQSCDSVQHFRSTHAHALSFFPENPYLDYLSHIQAFQFDRVFKGWNQQLIQGLQAEVYCTIFWATCGHRLSSLRKLSIGVHQLRLCDPQTLISVEHLCILFVLPSTPQRSDDAVLQEMKAAKSFVETLQSLQKPMTKSAAPLRIEYQDAYTWRFGWSRQWVRLASTLFEGLPVVHLEALHKPWQSPDTDWLRFHVSPETIDMTSVKTIQQWALTGDERRLDPRPFPSIGRVAVLQQCRSLVRLGLVLSQRDVDSDRLFKWAVQERSATPFTSDIAPTIKPSSNRGLVPLEEITLRIDGGHLQPVGYRLSNLIADMAFAFNSTLTSLSICERPYQSLWILDLSWFRDMPELRHLYLSAQSFECSATPFSECPKIESIHLEERYAYQAHRHPVFPVMFLPSLLSLTVIGPVIHRLDKRSFGSMENLKVLKLHETPSSGETWLKTIYKWPDSASSIFSTLEELDLEGPPAISLHMSMLSQCPCIRKLRLEAKVDLSTRAGIWFFHRYLIESIAKMLLRPVLDVGKKNEKDVADVGWPRSIPSLTSLSLKNWRLSQDIILGQLPSLFPNIQTLEIQSCTAPSSITRGEIFSSFKCLRWADINMDSPRLQ